MLIWYYVRTWIIFFLLQIYFFERFFVFYNIKKWFFSLYACTLVIYECIFSALAACDCVYFIFQTYHVSFYTLLHINAACCYEHRICVFFLSPENHCTVEAIISLFLYPYIRLFIRCCAVEQCVHTLVVLSSFKTFFLSFFHFIQCSVAPIL